VSEHEGDPIQLFLRVRQEALAAGEGWDASACALATVGESGRPAVRMVLSRDVDAEGFRIFTNLESRKARDLSAHPFAALAFHWDSVHTQFRVEGAVRPVPGDRADAYFATRNRESQIGAWASQQSRPIGSREELLEKVRALEAKFSGVPVPRPPHWGGFIVVPDRIERWQEGSGRLHHRTLWSREGDGWRSSTIQP
jgi:pyridoxamine 5'-phosphate oxidase